MHHKVLAYTLVALIFAATVSLLYYQEVLVESSVVPVLPQHRDNTPINSFRDCADAGFPIMESYPEQCRTDDGLLFVNYEFCIQVITAAKNPKTGEEREFPTPCDVPVSWQKITE